MKVLLVGSGGREHALAWRLSQGASPAELHAAPGNPGIAQLGACHPVRAEDVEGLLGLARSLEIDLVVVGPEAPLVQGVAERLRLAGIPVFGPSAAAARIEGSKAFAKDVMREAGVATARVLETPSAPCVVKADGLAGGKGVFVCRTERELERGLRAAAAFEGPPLVEELLEGEEVSVFALSDGRTALPLAPAQDYKRLLDGDGGPNTGGMGSHSPVPGFGAEEVQEVIASVHEPVLAELARRGSPFLGLLYAGLMLTEEGPRVLEFNCRFGDPETQSILPRVDGDLGAALAAAAAGELAGVELGTRRLAAVTVVLAAGSYPEGGDVGTPIRGLEKAAGEGGLVFHAGTALRDEVLVTNGGRILDVTALGGTLAEARRSAYAAADRIQWAGIRRREDIALEASQREEEALRA